MTKDKQGRMQSRRAASKEALKQMHSILVSDENKYEISSDDDDVIAIDVQPPPKKKYKLSSKKSSDDRDVIVLKTIPSNNANESPFDLDFTVEELSQAQKSRNETLSNEEKEIEAKVEQLVKNSNAEVIYNGICTTAVEITEHLQNVLNSNALQFATNDSLGGLSNVQQSVSNQSIMLQQQPTGNSAVPQSYQLVMDPRLGVIVGAVTTPNSSTNTPPLQLYQPQVTVPVTSTTNVTQEKTPAKGRRTAAVRQQVSNTPIPPLQKITLGPKNAAAKNTSTPAKGTIQVKSLAKAPLQTKPATTTPAKTTPIVRGRPSPASQQANFRPTESNVEGGLGMGKPNKSIDLTSDDRGAPDSREISFNKLQGRTYPSLVVVARPHLRVKDLSSDRGKLDVKVKSVLMYPPTKFTEWLIQQGLVRSDQKCSVHTNNALKLGMYSDATKFPYSGGYVWISECCPQRFVSVFSGSLFEGSQHPPMAILKLLYHWCCQTIVQNVTQWVKVDNLYVKGMYTWLRALCTVALHSHIKPLGGPGVKVQVGVISLGTTSQDGNKREVKVEVLGILETATRHIRLRAVEPLTDGERNYKKRFTKILEPVFNWVHPSSIIVTDLTVDKATLHQMGFSHVTQSTSTDYANSNRTIMEYLRRIVPRMFQNTLSLLSRQIIQQFLDELVWREWYGTTVLQCFENMVQHMSEQTRFDSGQSLIVRLNKVSGNPFKNWSIPQNLNTVTPNITNNALSVNNNTVPKISGETATPKRYSRQRKSLPATPITINQEVPRPAKSSSPDVPEQLVPLENYYYGTINSAEPNKPKYSLNIKCPLCKLTFNTNISLMNHLFKHAHNINNDVQLCKYCLTIVPTRNDLLKHIASTHPDETKFDNNFACLICEALFRNPFILGKHMSKEHCPSELPYVCGTCNHRCSNHKQAVDHFYTQHDQGNTIQCPFCLKSTTIYSGGRNITQNMNYFVQHLQKHQKKQLAKRCGRCVLWFIQKEYLKDHQIKMHASQRGKLGLVPSFAPRNGIMVPKSKMDKSPDDATVINFSALYFNISKPLNCKECGKLLTAPKHFVSFESCQNSNCQYSTCCSFSMQKHVTECKELNSKLPEDKLPYKMFCVCGYGDEFGNTLAQHLAICERKSAYPSVEAAQGATATHSMLDVLGLVRRPEESSGIKDKSPAEQTSKPSTSDETKKQKITDVVELNEDEADSQTSKNDNSEDKINTGENREEIDEVEGDGGFKLDAETGIITEKAVEKEKGDEKEDATDETENGEASDQAEKEKGADEKEADEALDEIEEEKLTDEIEKDKVTEDEIEKDKVTEDEIEKDKVTDDEIEKDKVTDDEIEKDKVTEDEIEKDKVTEDETEKEQVVDEAEVPSETEKEDSPSETEKEDVTSETGKEDSTDDTEKEDAVAEEVTSGSAEETETTQNEEKGKCDEYLESPLLAESEKDATPCTETVNVEERNETEQAMRENDELYSNIEAEIAKMTGDGIDSEILAQITEEKTDSLELQKELDSLQNDLNFDNDSTKEVLEGEGCLETRTTDILEVLRNETNSLGACQEDEKMECDDISVTKDVNNYLDNSVAEESTMVTD